jgi:replicative DNA helicase
MPNNPILFEETILPEINIQCLPEPFASFALSLTESLETPLGASILCVLGILSTIAQSRFSIQISPSYSEPLNLYLMVTMPPANRKSAILKYCQSPLLTYELLEKQRLEKSISEQTAAYKANLRYLEKLRNSYDGTSEKLEKIVDLETSLKPPLVYPKLFLTDSTPESLANALCEQNGRIALLSAEGGLFETISGLYTNGRSNIDTLLSGWSKDTVRIKRKDGEINIAPLITLFFIVQPIIVERMAKKSAFIGNGFMERFLYYAPQTNIGWRENKGTEIPLSILKEYENAILKILSASEKAAFVLTIAPEAKDLWHVFQNEIELQMRPSGRLYYIQSWAGKLSGQVLRIAGLICVAEHLNQSKIITKTHLKNAILIAEVLIVHALKVFDKIDYSKDISDAKRIWEYIISLNQASVANTNLTRKFKNEMKADRIRFLISILFDRHLITEVESSSKGRTFYHINPLLRQKTSK